MEIIPAGKADLPLLLPLQQELHSAHVAAQPDIFREVSDSDILAFFEKTLSDEKSRILVAKEGAGIAGYLIVVIKSQEASLYTVERTFGYIDQIIVDKKYRHLRVGHALIESAGNWCAGKGIDRLELHVSGFNTGARHFFEGNGFKESGSRMCRALVA
jgi:ribosomal protein S18 acetylase RimI-like enzyme